MKKYIIRNEHGDAVCFLKKEYAKNLILTLGGKWVQKAFVRIGEQTVYVFADNVVINVDENIRIPIYSGYYIYEIDL